MSDQIESLREERAPVLASDEINLRTYVLSAAERWRAILLIVIGTLVLGVAARALLLWSQDPIYEAFSDVVIVRSSSDLTFDERFTTDSGQSIPANFAAQRNALVNLASSPALSVEVLEMVGDQLAPRLQQPALLASAISAELVTAPGSRAGESDLVRITAVADSPEQATVLANAWAETFVVRANQLFGEVPNHLLTSVLEEQAAAQVDYDTARQAMETFLAQSQVESLTRQIEDLAQLILTLRNGQLDAVRGVVQALVDANSDVATAVAAEQGKNISEPYQAEQSGQRALQVRLIEAAHEGAAAIFDEQAARDLALLDGYYTRWLNVTTARDEAVALRAQADGAEEELLGSNAMVLTLLRLQAFTGVLDDAQTESMHVENAPEAETTTEVSTDQRVAAAPGVLQTSQPVQVQVSSPALQVLIEDGGALSREIFVGELDRLIETLTARRGELETSIAELSAEILSGERYAFLGESVPAESALRQAAAAIEVDTAAGAPVTDTVVSAPASSSAASSAASGDVLALANLVGLQGLTSSDYGGAALRDEIKALEESERALRSQLEAHNAEKARLEQQRDIALETLGTVTNKVAELSVARAVASTLVRQVGSAVAATQPVEAIALSLVLVFALMVGLFAALVYVVWAELRNPRLQTT